MKTVQRDIMKVLVKGGFGHSVDVLNGLKPQDNKGSKHYDENDQRYCRQTLQWHEIDPMLGGEASI